MRKTTDQFIIDAIKIHGNRYDYSKVIYINSKTKVEVICSIHGSFWQTPNNHLSKKQNCPFCYGKVKKTTKQFIIGAVKVHGDRYDYSKVNYINDRVKVEITCKEHGNFWQKPNDHLNKQGCPNCAKTSKKTTHYFIDKAIKVHGNKYDYSKVNYINYKTKVEIICKKHGSFWQNSNHHLNGSGCPFCNTSKGEEKIKEFLILNNINFIHQKTFLNCKYKYLLRFDFYLPEYNTCVEYDGIQHFKPIDFFGGEKSFQQTQIKDQIKNNYCLNNNINLLRIAYNEKINQKLGELNG